LRWWQVDLGYWFIRALALVGLAAGIKQQEVARSRSAPT
jgi:fatty-acid desaturase